MGLEPGPAPARLRDALAKALGDPTCSLPSGLLTVGLCRYWRNCLSTLTCCPRADADPARSRLPARCLSTTRNCGTSLELVRVAAAAANLALEHSRLRAEIQAQLEQVRASRARIVEAGDAARRRLERDLHDGAQQRLVTLSLALGMARSQAAGSHPELESLLESASKEAREALAELRELARGLHPAVLTETGLPGAVQALVERSPVATAVSAVPGGRFRPDRGRRLLRGVRGAGQRSQARASSGGRRL